LRYLNPCEKHPERVSSLKQISNNLKFNGIKFPMKIDDTCMSRFEKQIEGIFINFYGYEDTRSCFSKRIYPLRFSKKKNGIDLLLISKEGERFINHYIA